MVRSHQRVGRRKCDRLSPRRRVASDAGALHDIGPGREARPLQELHVTAGQSSCIRFLSAAILTAGQVSWFASTAAGAAVLPTGFSDELVAGNISAPSSLAFLPDGRALVIELNLARIRMIRNGAVSTLATVPNVRTGSERGLLGIAIDPAWPVRPYVYVHSNWNQAFEIRISRFTVTGDLEDTGAGDLAIDPASRYEVLTGLPDNAGNHNGGTVRFGNDGMLYVSLGEDAQPCEAQDLAALQGKILRLDVSGLPDGPGGPPSRASIVPADNPFAGDPDVDTRLVWAFGLRNPFRFSIDPASGTLYIGDVGQNEWEEIDAVAGGGQNLGWPWYEGDNAYNTCSGSPGTTLLPIHVYDHDRTGQEAVIGGPVYRGAGGGGSHFPAEYEGDLFFSDYYHGELVRLHRSGATWTVAAPVPGQPSSSFWGTGFEFVSDYAVAADGSIWFTKQDVNEVRRIRFTPTIDVANHSVFAPPGNELFDLQGRRVEKTGRSGIYFTRSGRTVVLP
jgi:glucose/arabinose dehydrogenase